MNPDQIAALRAPISAAEPCGPDLDELGDPEFQGYVARIEGELSQSFAALKSAKIDYKAEFAAVGKLLARSRDLRLLVPLAKLHILKGDLAPYTAVFELVADLVDKAWPTLAPSLQAGPELRIATLQALDDPFPLQAAQLFRERRFGVVSFRSHLLASGQVKPRGAQGSDQPERVPSPADLTSAIANADLADLVAAHTSAASLQQAVRRIERLVGEKSGKVPEPLSFTRLSPLVDGLAQFLEEAVRVRDPSQAALPVGKQETEGEGVRLPTPPVVELPALTTTADARAALDEIASFFARAEPSSPILLIIAQARALVGRNFYETMEVLIPKKSEDARLRIGQEPGFDLPLKRLAELLPSANREPERGSAESADSPSEEAEASAGNGTASVEAPISAPSPGAPLPGAVDRPTAMALLKQVAEHFRRAEPSSPIPLLLDRAASMAGKDFFSLLRETFAAGVLRVDD